MFSKNVIKSLEEKSSKAISVFRKTVEELASINEAAAQEIVITNKTIDQLKSEVANLEVLQSDNEKIIKNINKIFE